MSHGPPPGPSSAAGVVLQNTYNSPLQTAKPCPRPLEAGTVTLLLELATNSTWHIFLPLIPPISYVLLSLMAQAQGCIHGSLDSATLQRTFLLRVALKGGGLLCHPIYWPEKCSQTWNMQSPKPVVFYQASCFLLCRRRCKM